VNPAPHFWLRKNLDTRRVYPGDIGKDRFKRLSMFNRPVFEMLGSVCYVYGGKKITVLSGFMCDFSSIPALLWPLSKLVPRFGEQDAAGVIHDALCRFGIFDEKTADLIWRQACIDAGVPKWRASLMYRMGLRLAAPFRKHGYEAGGDRSLVNVYDYCREDDHGGKNHTSG